MSFLGVAAVVGKMHLVMVVEKGCAVWVRSLLLSECQGKVLRPVGMVLVVVLVRERVSAWEVAWSVWEVVW